MAGGKRAGKRAGSRERAQFRPDLALMAVAITAAVVGWGFLVFTAIGFGADARQDGGASSWLLLIACALAAMACLFLAFMLAARLARALGIASAPESKPKRDPNAPKGGKRAAR
ncbi:hypothetical protein KG112_02830 [Nocardioides sp. zg-ZUI104]|uniref:hypothetical protein n=1 Tax=Nocardioides faecalis TaxID=2803858 RepID=UPI001BCE7B6F|nr:hypothetical protein [Nocardioides faecalis]MBS4751742.1 hypothetical protein [Nocardioides faecalis]